MKLTWYGHAAFRIEAGDAVILIDPFLTGNPSFKGNVDDAAKGVTHVLLTHGHNDHFGDTLAILKNTGAMFVGNAELSDYVSGKDIGEGRVNPANHGGTVDCGGFTVTLVNAVHSSAITQQDGTSVYLGNPNGLVLHFPDGRSLYHMGDTDIFGDMALINELHHPEIGLVPVGDRFTMGGAVAALACKRFFDFKTVVPCHYGTFPIIDQTPDKFVEGMEGSGAKIVLPKIGEATEV